MFVPPWIQPLNPLHAIQAGTDVGLRLRQLSDNAMVRREQQRLQESMAGERATEAANRLRLGYAQLGAEAAQRQDANAMRALTIDQQNQRAAEALRVRSADNAAKLMETAALHAQQAGHQKEMEEARNLSISLRQKADEERLKWHTDLLNERAAHNVVLENKPATTKPEDELAKGKALIAAGQSLLKTDTGDPQGKAFIDAGKALISKHVPKPDFSADIAKDPWVAGMSAMTNTPAAALPSTPAGIGQGRKLTGDKAMIQSYLRKAGGDKQKAAQMAMDDGWDVTP